MYRNEGFKESYLFLKNELIHSITRAITVEKISNLKKAIQKSVGAILIIPITRIIKKTNTLGLKKNAFTLTSPQKHFTTLFQINNKK
ncbi:hypothetical protein [Brevibacillus laterosporus]|uniref:Uncharacterized protein n=2 Tax=Brevibacillus TaxID=55080 RepID=A0A0F7BZU2_BRELA|nr:hypothetical protein EX87_08945 [Brevibacillus laterosporus]